ncbi:MAG: hypothetical protein RIQ79_799, partial [Verrucomicrobiota bacterium]
FDGPPEEATSRYFALQAGKISESEPGMLPALRQDPLIKRIQANDILTSARARQGGESVSIQAASFRNEKGLHDFTVKQSSAVVIDIVLQAKNSTDAAHVGVHLYDRMNNLVFAAGSPQLQVCPPRMAAGESIIVTIEITLSVQPGHYTFSLNCAEISAASPNLGSLHDRHDGLGPIHVWQEDGVMHPFYGIARLPMTIEFHH